MSYVEEEQHRVPTGHIISGQIWPGVPEILPWVVTIDADEVWDANDDLTVDGGAIAGVGITVAVLDTGIQWNHPDLVANLDLANSFDFVSNDSDPSDIPGPVTGHGTATSGIVAAVDNNIGVIGTAPVQSNHVSGVRLRLKRLCHWPSCLALNWRTEPMSSP